MSSGSRGLSPWTFVAHLLLGQPPPAVAPRPPGRPPPPRPSPSVLPIDLRNLHFPQPLPESPAPTAAPATVDGPARPLGYPRGGEDVVHPGPAARSKGFAGLLLTAGGQLGVDAVTAEAEVFEGREVPGQDVRSLFHQSRPGHRGGPWGPWPASAGRAGCEPKAIPLQRGADGVTLSLGAVLIPNIRAVDCSWSQALPSRGGASPLGGLACLLPAL